MRVSGRSIHETSEYDDDGSQVTIPAGMAMFHSTSVYFENFSPNPTWFDLDTFSGFRMVANDVQKIGRRDVIVKKMSVVEDLRLFNMAPVESRSIDAFKALGLWTDDQENPTELNKEVVELDSLWHNRNAHETKDFVRWVRMCPHSVLVICPSHVITLLRWLYAPPRSVLCAGSFARR